MDNLEGKLTIEEAKALFHSHVKNLQDEITQELKRVDSEIQLEEDIWDRNDYKGLPGGGGITRAFNGPVIENAGVNTSLVKGFVDPGFAEKLGGTSDVMWAAGISLIIHPINPRVPTVHANFRMIQVGEKFWFGGGADLTPFYPHEDDFYYFHNIWKEALDKYGYYELMKNECDKYFVNTHRNNEMRGVGGFFFDHFNTNDIRKDLSMITDISKQFIKSYFPIVDKRKNEMFDEDDVDLGKPVWR